MGTTAAIYCRISSDDQRDGLGVKRQENDCRALAKARGWTVAPSRIYVDNDLSAASHRTERPGFTAMCDAIDRGKVGAVVAWDLDRITRSPLQLEQFVDRCESAGVLDLATVSGDLNLGTGDGLLTARIKGAVAAQEITNIRKRVRAKKAELARDGKPSGGGTRPFGFELDRVTVVPAEADLIREAATAVLGGESITGVCRRWNAAGIPTVTGAKWSTPVLRSILQAPRVAGLRAHNGAIVGEAVWPAILEREQWEPLAAMLAARAIGGDRNTTAHLLTGLLVCGNCGDPLNSGKNNGLRAYRCSRAEGKRNGCGLSIAAEPLEDHVVAEVAAKLDTPGFLSALHADQDATATAEDYREVVTIEGKLTELADEWAADRLTMAEWKTARTALETRLDAARERIARTPTPVTTDAMKAMSGKGEFLALWGGLDRAHRREFLGLFVESITITPAVRGRNRFDPARATIKWRYSKV